MAESRYKLGFIGLGNMASAILHGILSKDNLPASVIAAYDVDEAKCSAFKGNGIAIMSDAGQLTRECEYVFLCIKPQVMGDVISSIRMSAGQHNVFVSIAAGIGAQYIKDGLGFDAKLILVMPNTPLMLGAGASALACVEPTSAQEFAFVKNIFASAGVSEEIPADKLKEIIPVNGSSPAFIYLFAKIVADYASEHGIAYDVALRLFSQTLIGSARMLTESGMTPTELIRMVSSPGGTTVKALASLEENGFATVIRSAMKACIDRAYELGK